MRPYQPNVRRQLIETSLRRWETSVVARSERGEGGAEAPASASASASETNETIHVKAGALR